MGLNGETFGGRAEYLGWGARTLQKYINRLRYGAIQLKNILVSYGSTPDQRGGKWNIATVVNSSEKKSRLRYNHRHFSSKSRQTDTRTVTKTHQKAPQNNPPVCVFGQWSYLGHHGLQQPIKSNPRQTVFSRPIAGKSRRDFMGHFPTG